MVWILNDSQKTSKPLLLYFLQVLLWTALSITLTRFRRSSCLWTACGYLGLDDGLGAGLQHGEVVGEHQELQLLCLQHHLNVVLHSSRLDTHTHTHTHRHRYRNRHRWKRATESITPLLDHTQRNRLDQWRSQLITAASFLCDQFSIECQGSRL